MKIPDYDTTLITNRWRRDAGLTAVAGPERTNNLTFVAARYCPQTVWGPVQTCPAVADAHQGSNADSP